MPNYFLVAGTNDIDTDDPIPATISATDAQDIANQATQAAIASRQVLPSGCSIVTVSGIGGTVELTMGANPRTFSAAELDGLIYRLQVERTLILDA